jgi:uncharacterized protein YijF (DUF1287 family)
MERAFVMTLVALTPLAVAPRQDTSEVRMQHLVAAAIAQTRAPVTYDGSYRRIPYTGESLTCERSSVAPVQSWRYRATLVPIAPAIS